MKRVVRRVTRIVRWGWLGALCGGPPLLGQAGNVPNDPKTLVVKVQAFYEGSGAPETGAGIVFGAAGNTLFIATAGHVIQRDTAARAVWVRFVSGDSAQATVAHPRDGALDLAVLSVAGDPAHLARWAPPAWDRLGNVRSLGSYDPVSAVGCPLNRCWEAPSPADRVVGKDRLGILFQSSFVRRGSSGGALFNQWWEVVGMVTRDEPPRAEAIPIDEVLAQTTAWGFPVGLERPSIPRPGYRTTIGVALLTATSSSAGPGGGDSRTPSGRVTMVRQALPAVSWHLAALRLAPANLAITAGMAGVGLHLKQGRFALDPFVEAGFGHVESRYDLGGYYVAAGGGTTYVPLWSRVVGDGLGVGGGATLEVIALPRTILEITAGYWSFTMPLNAPKLKKLFVGGGVRLGL